MMFPVLPSGMNCFVCDTPLVQASCPDNLHGCLVWHGKCPKCTTPTFTNFLIDENGTVQVQELGDPNIFALAEIGDLYERYLGGLSALTTLTEIGEILNDLKRAREVKR